MASLSFRDFDLNQTTITGRRNPTVILDTLRVRYKMDAETQQRTDVPDGYVADILVRNRLQSVKLPLEAVSDVTFKKIDDALINHKIVKVNFGENASTLRGRCYALMSGNRLLSGISCTATELNVVSIEDVVDELDDLDLDIIN